MLISERDDIVQFFPFFSNVYINIFIYYTLKLEYEMNNKKRRIKYIHIHI